MEQKYERPELEIILLDACDLITTSGTIDDSDTPIGGEGYDSFGWT